MREISEPYINNDELKILQPTTTCIISLALKKISKLKPSCALYAGSIEIAPAPAIAIMHACIHDKHGQGGASKTSGHAGSIIKSIML